jgi:hypothetical protein
LLARTYRAAFKHKPTQHEPSSARLQSNDGNFGRAAETEWEIDRADASIDVELHPVAQSEKPLHISGSHFREKKRGQEGETNLASMGMSGEHQGNLAPDHIIGKIGLMGQQNKRFLVRVPACRQSGGEVGTPLKSILDTGQPQNCLPVREWYGLEARR